MSSVVIKRQLLSMFAAPFRQFWLYGIDMVICGVSLSLSLVLRFGIFAPIDRFLVLFTAVPIFIVVCSIVFPLSGLYSKHWRYASIADLVAITKAVILASFLFVFLMFLISRLESIPRSVIAIEIFVLISFLAAARLSFRLDELQAFATIFNRAKSNHQDFVPVLLVGAGDAADLYIRALQRDLDSIHWPVGFLDNAPANQGLTLRGIPVLGTFDDFDNVVLALEQQGEKPRHVVFTEPVTKIGKRAAEELIDKAESFGITTSLLPPMTELRNSQTSNQLELRPIELTDLLERPQVAPDRAALKRLVLGRRVLITGAGGSIGSELTQQIAALQPAELILLENSEYNLYAIDLELRDKPADVPRVCYLCDIRNADRVTEIFDRHRPELVFHAAALKHVPLVEHNPCEGVLTNVIGTMNVANAVRRVNARAMVQISTDKAVNATSVMGASKRLAELYCQALDRDDRAGPDRPKFMTVRFGNVLGSSGSLIPLFNRQLARGGPLTVTSPQMKRFFMTIREAVELTLQGSAYGLEKHGERGEIFVLDMGEPIRIIDIARRMIRLANYEPDKDIQIKIIGRRPGEKLSEELFDSSESRVASPVPGVLCAISKSVPICVLEKDLSGLRHCAETSDADGLLQIIGELLPSFRGDSSADESPQAIAYDQAATVNGEFRSDAAPHGKRQPASPADQAPLPGSI